MVTEVPRLYKRAYKNDGTRDFHHGSIELYLLASRREETLLSLLVRWTMLYIGFSHGNAVLSIHEGERTS